ncbi:MAG: transposase [Bacteroidales bacterium]
MSYVKIWVHAVWGTKWRYPVDHFHCLVRLGPDQSIADVIKLIKGEFSCWVNKAGLSKRKFQWAREYYAASVNERSVRHVKRYIRNQEAHHLKQTYYQEVAKYFEEHSPEV